MTDSLVGNDKLTGYTEAVDVAVAARCGKDYSHLVDMAPSMDPDGKLIRGAIAIGFTPQQFAKAFQRAHCLACVEETPNAGDFNRHVAALINFGDSERRLRMANDGRPYCMLPDGTALKLTVITKGDEIKFAAFRSETEVTLVAAGKDNLGRVAAPETGFKFVVAHGKEDPRPVLNQAVRMYLDSSPTNHRGAPIPAAAAPEAETSGMHI